jgi:hypothetical protein
MPKPMSMKAPSWMAKNPKPVLVPQRFHDRELHVWKGEVDVNDIEGWIGNPRTELLRDEFSEQFAREPTNDEMCQLVLADEDEKEGLKIKELAANIRKNGVRTPIVLTFKKKLLDGNRRYYACMFLMGEGAQPKDRDTFAQIPAFALPEGTKEDVEDAIITEFNFAANMQLEWPYYIRARRVFIDHDENGLDKEQLHQKYGVPWRYLDKWVKAARLCDLFLKFHDESLSAKQFAYRNFIMFDEMMRNYGARFNVATFRNDVFQALLNGYEPENHKNHTFTKSADVLRLDELYDNPDAWHALTSAKGPQALRDALGILEISNLSGASDPNPALRRVVNGLQRLVKNKSLVSANQELLETFHEQAELVPGGPTDPAAQIEQMVEWLEEMTTKEVAELSQGSLTRLERAMTLVRDMSAAAATKKAKRATTATA